MQFLADYWVVCPVFGCFMGGLTGLWVVCGWFRVLQLTEFPYKQLLLVL